MQYPDAREDGITLVFVVPAVKLTVQDKSCYLEYSPESWRCFQGSKPLQHRVKT